MVAFALLASVLVPITTVSATKPIELRSWGEALGEEAEYEELPSGLLKYSFISEQACYGDVEGKLYNYGKGIIRPDKGLLTLDAWGTIEDCIVHLPDGTDKVGTMTFRNRVTISPKLWQGNFAIISGTGELENMRGHGSFEWIGDTVYVIWWVHFDPR